MKFEYSKLSTINITMKSMSFIRNYHSTLHDFPCHLWTFQDLTQLGRQNLDKFNLVGGCWWYTLW